MAAVGKVVMAAPTMVVLPVAVVVVLAMPQLISTPVVEVVVVATTEVAVARVAKKLVTGVTPYIPVVAVVEVAQAIPLAQA